MSSTLTYELERLETLLMDLIQLAEEGTGLDNYSPTAEALAREVEQSKRRFIHEVFAFHDELHLERYIQFHQQELIRILDRILKDKQPRLHSDRKIALATQAVEELLDFIERHFTRYFDQNTKAPDSYISVAGTEVVKAEAAITGRLTDAGADPLLIELMTAPLRKFIEQIPQRRITYRKIIFVKEVQKELHRQFEQNLTAHQLDSELRRALLYLNYNSLRYFGYYTDYINTQVAGIETPRERFDRLSYILKIINQTPVKPAVAYNTMMRPLKEQLVDWLAEEIAYLERIYHLNIKPEHQPLKLQDDFKIKLEMSVPQIAFLLRIFVETKTIHNKNVSDLIRFFSRTCQTKRLESISYESFRVRYYNIEDSTRKSVRSVLLSLVDYINNAP